jgi:alkylhydroperoxidase family enzyme
MPEPRIAPLSSEAALAAGQAYGLPDVYSNTGVFRVLLCHPALAERLGGLLQFLMGSDILDPVLREIAVLRIGWVTGAEYEWTHHYAVARRLGMTDEEVAAVRAWPDVPAPRGAAGAAILRATDEILDGGAISDDTWAALRDHVGGDAACVQVLVAVSNWRMFSTLLRSLHVPMDEGLPTWPPDGRVP